MFGKKKIGVCLSAGGAKGLAHIGVIKELINAKIPIHCITGTSSGALIGGIYAYTGDITMVETVVREMTKKSWYKLMIKDFRPFRKGLITGKAIKRLIENIVGEDALIERCKIPLRIVAADLRTGTERVFTEGSLVDAIRASISLPLTFAPVIDEYDILVDGSALNPAPVRECRKMGANKVILSSTCRLNEGCFIGKVSKYGIIHNYMMNSTAALIRHSAKEADVVLEPDVGHIDTLEFWRGNEAISEGEYVTTDAMEKIERIKKFWTI